MGVIIYIDGEIKTENASPQAMKELVDVRDERGDLVFEETEEQVLTFIFESVEALYNPGIDRFVKQPLEKLVETAKKNGVGLNGWVRVSSDWPYCDDISIDVTEQGLEIWNTVIHDASTEELLRELEHRGIHVPKKETEQS